MTITRPWTPEEIEALKGMRSQLFELDDLTGGWTTKADLRERGLSLHIKFDHKANIDASTKVLAVFDQAPIRLCTIVCRILDQLGIPEDETATEVGEEE